MARRCWTCIGVVGLWLIGASAAVWGQESSPAPTAKSSPGVNNKLVETLTLERLRLEQQFQQTAVKIQSLVKEIRRVQELERQQLGATLVPTHPRMLRVQQAQEKSERAILTLQELVEKMNAAQLELAALGGESVPPRDDQKRMQRIEAAYQAAFGNEVEVEALRRQAQAQAQPQAEVMKERMRKMEEYLLKTNFATVEKARQQAEMKQAAEVVSRALEELAQKQDANSQVQPGGESPSVPLAAAQEKTEPEARSRAPRQAANPFSLPNNPGTPGLVRPLYQPGPARPSPEQLQELQLLMQKMSAQPAKPANIEKRLEQLEGRLERIETLLQRLVQEPPPKRD